MKDFLLLVLFRVGHSEIDDFFFVKIKSWVNPDLKLIKYWFSLYAANINWKEKKAKIRFATSLFLVEQICFQLCFNAFKVYGMLI